MRKKILCLALSALILSTSALIPMAMTRPQEYFFTVHIMTTEPRLPFCEVLKAEMAKVGVEVIIDTMEWGTTDEVITGNRAPYAEGGWDMELSGHLEVEPDPGAMRELFHSESIAPLGENFGSIRDPRVDELFDLASTTMDFEERTELYQDMYRILYDEQYLLCLFQVEAIILFANGVTGIEEFAEWRPTVSDPFWDSQWISVPDTDTFIFAEYFWYSNLCPIWWNYLTGIYGTLLRLDPDYELVPDLAESWDVSPDGKTYTFHLRSGVTWHDGEPFTSKDVKFSIEVRMIEELGAAMYGTLTDLVESVETPNDLTVVVHLKKASPMFPYHMSKYTKMEILPEHIWKDIPVADWRTSEWNTEKAAPGTGPWKFVEVTEAYLKLEANEDYYFDPPKMKYIVYQRIPEKTTALAALRAGEVHCLDFFYRFEADFPEIEKMTEIQWIKCDRFDVEGGYFNLNHPILANKWVRKAFSYAFPREEFISTVYNNIGKPSLLPLPVGHWAQPPELTVYPYDLDKAKECLEKAGYKQEYLKPVETPWTMYAIFAVVGLVVGVAITTATFTLRKRK